jgi:alpha-1,3-mannosyltransferase
MRIAHVVRQFHPSVGGFESVVFELVSRQAADGHSVRVVTLDRIFNAPAMSRLPKRGSVGNAEIVRVPFFGSSRYPIAPAVLPHIADADIVHVHAIDFLFDFLAWTKPFHRRPLIVSTHGGFFHTDFAATLKRLYFATITRVSLSWYDAVVAVSANDQELFGRVRQRGIVCIENGVDVSKYWDVGAKQPKKTIAWIGRFALNKRLDRLVALVAALRRRDPEWSLKIIGRPWDLQAADIATLAHTAGIGDAVEIVTSPTDDEIRHHLGKCSVLVNCSEYEGFGIVVLEAMSAALFPLLSDIPAFRRLVERSGVGMLVDFSDADAAAEKVREKWEEIESGYPELRRKLMRLSEEFEWRHSAADYMRLYQSVRGTDTRTILDVPVLVRTRAQAIELLDRCFDERKNTAVLFANANCLNAASDDGGVRAALRKAVVINDGLGIDLASRLLFGSAFPYNLNGTDFMPYYLQHTRHSYKIFLLGGRPGVAERAARALERACPRHRIVGCRDGYFDRGDDPSVADDIRATGADIVVVCMGNPQQELWLRDNLAATGCRLGVGAGGLFDFISGEARRAPSWLRALRLEWLFRLLREPGRLWRRYIIGNPVFMLRVIGQWWSGARV